MCFFPFSFLSPRLKMYVMTGATAAILGSEVSLRMEAMCWGWQSRKERGNLGSWWLWSLHTGHNLLLDLLTWKGVFCINHYNLGFYIICTWTQSWYSRYGGRGKVGRSREEKLKNQVQNCLLVIRGFHTQLPSKNFLCSTYSHEWWMSWRLKSEGYVNTVLQY